MAVKTVVSNLGEEEGDGDNETDLDTAEVDVATLPLGAAGGEQSELLVGPRLLPHARLLHLQGYFKVFKIHFVVFKHNPSRPEVKLFQLARNCDIYQIFSLWTEWSHPGFDMILLNIYLQNGDFSLISY